MIQSERGTRAGESLVVLPDDAGAPIGSAAKEDVHHAETPLHLAFSCYLFDGHGRLLLSRRALVKRTWPGVWTNSFCGHPAPGESIENAVRRHAHSELGVGVDGLVEVLPDFRYSARDANGILENEVCPVFFASTADPVVANPDEVSDWAWVEPAAFATAITATPEVFSPWAALQIAQLGDRLTQLAASSGRASE